MAQKSRLPEREIGKKALFCEGLCGQCCCVQFVRNVSRKCALSIAELVQMKNKLPPEFVGALYTRRAELRRFDFEKPKV